MASRNPHVIATCGRLMKISFRLRWVAAKNKLFSLDEDVRHHESVHGQLGGTA